MYSNILIYNGRRFGGEFGFEHKRWRGDKNGPYGINSSYLYGFHRLKRKDDYLGPSTSYYFCCPISKNWMFVSRIVKYGRKR